MSSLFSQSDGTSTKEMSEGQTIVRRRRRKESRSTTTRCSRYYSCGSNVDGRLGLGGEGKGNREGCRTVLTALSSLALGEALILSCGRAHTVCATASGDELYSWGCDESGQLGMGPIRTTTTTTTSNSDPYNDEQQSMVRPAVFVPTKVPMDGFLSTSKDEQSHRNNDENETAGTASSSLPELRTWRKSVTTLACGDDHTLLVVRPTIISASAANANANASASTTTITTMTMTTTVYVCGNNDYGQLGTGDLVGRTQFVPAFLNLAEETVVAVAGGASHSLVLTVEGRVYAVGRGSEGQLGYDHRDRDNSSNFHRRTVARRVEGLLRDRVIMSVCCSRGGHGSYAVTIDGCGWRWGSVSGRETNLDDDECDHDVIGDDDDDVQVLPVPLPHPLGGPLHRQSDPGPPPIQSLNSARNMNMNMTTTMENQQNHHCYDDNAKHDDYSSVCVDEEDNNIPKGRRDRSSSFDLTSVRRVATAALRRLHTSGIDDEDDVDVDNNSDDVEKSQAPRSAIVALSAGRSHAVFVTRSGEAYALGRSGPQLGVGSVRSSMEKLRLRRLLTDGGFLANGVSCGDHHTLLSGVDGRVLSCGDGRYGVLGLTVDDGLDAASGPTWAVPVSVTLPRPQSFAHHHQQQRRGPSVTVSESTHGREAVWRHHFGDGAGDGACAGGSDGDRCRSPPPSARWYTDDDKDDNDNFVLKQPRANTEGPLHNVDVDEDYWAVDENEVGLGDCELDADFNRDARSSPSFGGMHTTSSNPIATGMSSHPPPWKPPLVASSGAVLSGVVSRFRPGPSRNPDQQNRKHGHGHRQRHHNHVNGDSFDGLLGATPKRRIIMVAGRCHSCVHVVDLASDDDSDDVVSTSA